MTIQFGGYQPPQLLRLPQSNPSPPVTTANVTLTLTGQKATFTQGTLGLLHAQALTGAAITSTKGAIGLGHAQALTGQKITSAQGSLGLAHAQALTGRLITSSHGTVTPGSTLAIPGRSITSIQGSLGLTHTQGLTGGLITSHLGTITATEGLVIALTGQKITSALGTLALGHAQALSGGLITSTLGVILPASADVTVTLSGLRATFIQGVLTLSGDAVPFTGAKQDAGGLKRRLVYLIKVDGREFATGSLAEALDILAEVKRLARLHAQQVSRQATETALRAAARALPELRLPKITASRPLVAAVREVRKEIEDIYAGAFRDAEIAMWLEVSRRSDEDEDITLLLM